MNLGALIKALESQPQDHTVRFDFAYFYPKGIDSYRGFYNQLALGYTNEGDEPTVADVLRLCREAVGEVFGGYKGGDYQMDENTKVWVSNWGEACPTAVTGVVDLGYRTVITTANDEW